MKALLHLSAYNNTWNQYSKPWARWSEYIQQITGRGAGDIYLQGLTKEEKPFRLILFMKHLYDQGLRQSQITKVLTAMSSLFQANAVDTMVFTNPLVLRAKRGTVGTREELEVQNRRKLENPTLPMASDMVMEGRKLFWEGKSWDMDGMDSRVIWLVIGLGFNFGARIGQLTLARRKKITRELIGQDHCLKTKDVRFYFSPDCSIRKTVILKGAVMFRGKVTSETLIRNISAIELSFLTGKISTNVVGVKRIGRSTAEETQLLEDICLWVLKAKPGDDDELTSRYDLTRRTNNKKVVTPFAINKGIKILATSFGLPPSMFSSRSLRSGLASEQRAIGASDASRNQIGGWAENSRVPAKHYVHQVGIQGTLSMSSDPAGIWSVAQVQNLIDRR